MLGSAECSTDIIEVGIIKNPYSIYHFPTISHQNPFWYQSHLLLTISFVFSWCAHAQRVNPTSEFEEATKYQRIPKIYSGTNWYNFWTKLKTACVNEISIRNRYYRTLHKMCCNNIYCEGGEAQMSARPQKHVMWSRCRACDVMWITYKIVLHIKPSQTWQLLTELVGFSKSLLPWIDVQKVMLVVLCFNVVFMPYLFYERS